jgi:methylated-DNA-[protein]-cysteine S-methyltransferase
MTIRVVAFSTVNSPVGRLFIAATDEGVRCIERERSSHMEMIGSHWEERVTPLIRETRGQLAAYFARTLRRFDLPLEVQGSAFQQKVWRALQVVPYGTTCSYSDIAQRIGEPRAMRAVGAANGRNPISIVVPCHRVIGADGALTGYGGGMEMKRYLLELEGSLTRRLG